MDYKTQKKLGQILSGMDPSSDPVQDVTEMLTNLPLIHCGTLFCLEACGGTLHRKSSSKGYLKRVHAHPRGAQARGESREGIEEVFSIIQTHTRKIAGKS